MESGYIKYKEIKPALTNYIKKAHVIIKESPVPDEAVIHDVRVLMKKCRAVTRLLSGQIESEAYERDFGTYREVGKLMSSWRESSVHRKILKDLKKKYPDIFEALSDNQKIDVLLKKPEFPEEPDIQTKENLEAIDELLSKAGYRLRFQTWNELDPKLLIAKLDESYITVTNAYLACRHNPKQSNIHRFRKKTKDFLYQLWFFRPLNPQGIKNLEKRLDALSQNLGKCNDLSVLLSAIDYKFAGKVENIALEKLAILIREQQDKYLAKIWPSANKLFSPDQIMIKKLGFKILIIG